MRRSQEPILNGADQARVECLAHQLLGGVLSVPLGGVEEPIPPPNTGIGSPEDNVVVRTAGADMIAPSNGHRGLEQDLGPAVVAVVEVLVSLRCLAQRQLV